MKKGMTLKKKMAVAFTVSAVLISGSVNARKTDFVSRLMDDYACMSNAKLMEDSLRVEMNKLKSVMKSVEENRSKNEKVLNELMNCLESGNCDTDNIQDKISTTMKEMDRSISILKKAEKRLRVIIKKLNAAENFMKKCCSKFMNTYRELSNKCNSSRNDDCSVLSNKEIVKYKSMCE